MWGEKSSNFGSKLARLGLAGRALVVSGLVCGVWMVIAPLAYLFAGLAGPIAAAVGAAVCLLGGLLGLLIESLFQRPFGAMQSMLVSMMARMLLPLLLGVVLHLELPSLARGGMIFYLLGFYLLILFVETMFLLARVNQPSTPDKPI